MQKTFHTNTDKKRWKNYSHADSKFSQKIIIIIVIELLVQLCSPNGSISTKRIFQWGCCENVKKLTAKWKCSFHKNPHFSLINVIHIMCWLLLLLFLYTSALGPAFMFYDCALTWWWWCVVLYLCCCFRMCKGWKIVSLFWENVTCRLLLLGL